jgi:hypothetical protein
LVILSKIQVVPPWRKHRNFADEIQNVMKMKQIMMLLAAMLLTACSKNSEVKAATLQEAGKTLVVYYKCHEIVTSLTSQIQADVMRIEPVHSALVFKQITFPSHSPSGSGRFLSCQNSFKLCISGANIQNIF